MGALRRQPKQDVLFELLTLGLCVFPKLLLLLPLLLLQLFALLLPGFRFLPEGVSDVPGVLGDGGAAGLLEPEVVLLLILVHLHAPFFVLLVDFPELLVLPLLVLRAEPLLVQNVAFQE